MQTTDQRHTTGLTPSSAVTRSRKPGRQSLHNCRRHALERTFVNSGRRCLRGAVVRGDREKEKE